MRALFAQTLLPTNVPWPSDQIVGWPQPLNSYFFWPREECPGNDEDGLEAIWITDNERVESSTRH